MKNTDPRYQAYIDILKEELLPAMGCTEPIALAYAAAVARKELGKIPERVLVEASGSIIKNVKSVIVPNTNNLKGIPAAAAAGIIAGKPELELQVISSVSQQQILDMRSFMNRTPIEVVHVDNGITFDIIVTLYAGESYVKVRIANYHTNIVLIEKDGAVLREVPVSGEDEEGLTDRSLLSLEAIWDFIHTVDIGDIKDILDVQINYNMAIAEEGLKGSYGANIGSILLKTGRADTATKAAAYAAAGSDARMSGCEMPVIINSGSGNQGITSSVPVIVYARELGVSDETMYRALAFSNLATIHQKSHIGRLSAYCGAVSAGAGSGAAIAYLNGCSFQECSNTLLSAIAVLSGMVCDGAKASCAAKIAEAVNAGILGYNMAINGSFFNGGDGIVSQDDEDTICNVGRLAKDGMHQTNEEIIDIMIHC